MKIAPAVLALAASLLASPVLAQTTPPARSSDLGAGLSAGGPGDRTGSVTAAGQTKPPGAALGPDGSNDRLDEKSRELDKKIQNGICTGCK